MASSSSERGKKYRALRRGGPPRKKLPCGTRAAYNRHIRAGEDPCQPCNEANLEYKRERRSRGKE